MSGAGEAQLCAGQGEVKTLLMSPLFQNQWLKLRAATNSSCSLKDQPRAPSQPPQGLCSAEKGSPLNAMEKAEQQLYFSPVAMKCLQK